jgi:drug/metabolite transporter (DMT)-like permease
MLYRQNLVLGAVLIVASEAMFASMGACVKGLSVSLPNEMVVFLRNAFGLLLLSPLILSYRASLLQTKVARLHLLRAGAGLSAMYCFFYALGNLHLADGMLLKMTAPLFMPLIAWSWLGEKARRLALMAIPVGFVGVAFVLTPDGDFNWIALIGLLGGALAALAKVTIRRLGQSEPTIRVVCYFALFATPISAIPLSWAWQTPSLSEMGLGLLLGLFGATGQFMLTRGYAVASASNVSPFTYFSVIFAAIYGYLFWDESLNHMFVAGATLIAVAGIMALRSGRIDTDQEM